MKLQLSKKFFAFIITLMVFSAIPGIANAQQADIANGQQKGITNPQQGLDDAQYNCRTCPHGWGCCLGYRCYSGRCRRYIYMNSDPIHTDDVLSLSDSTSADFSLELTEAQNVSLKIYDATGRLIKTLAESTLPEGENQIEWNKTDLYGNTVSAGIYILQLEAGFDYSDTRKLSVMN